MAREGAPTDLYRGLRTRSNLVGSYFSVPSDASHVYEDLLELDLVLNEVNHEAQHPNKRTHVCGFQRARSIWVASIMAAWCGIGSIIELLRLR